MARVTAVYIGQNIVSRYRKDKEYDLDVVRNNGMVLVKPAGSTDIGYCPYLTYESFLKDWIILSKETV